MDPTIQPTIVHLNQATGPGHSDQNHFPIRILNSGIDIPRSGRNIDNLFGMNLQVPIVTKTPKSNIDNNFYIFEFFSRTLDFAYRALLWRGTMKS